MQNVTVQQFVEQAMQVDLQNVLQTCCDNGTQIEDILLVQRVILNIANVTSILQSLPNSAEVISLLGEIQPLFQDYQNVMNLNMIVLANQTLTLLTKGYFLSFAEQFKLDETSYYQIAEQQLLNILTNSSYLGNFDKRPRYYEQAAQLGSPDALHNLALINLQGKFPDRLPNDVYWSDC